MNIKWQRLTRIVLGGLGVAGAALILASGCDARYRDVSGDPRYAPRVGQKCVVLKELRAHGFTLDLSRKDVTHEVDVTTLPGIGGPEITFTEPIPKGTTLNIIRVRQCWNCLAFDNIDYEVSIPKVQRLAGYHVFARAEALSRDETQCTENKR